MFDHLTRGTSLPESQVVRAVPRAAGAVLALTDLPPILVGGDPGSDAIRFRESQVIIPE